MRAAKSVSLKLNVTASQVSYKLHTTPQPVDDCVSSPVMLLLHIMPPAAFAQPQYFNGLLLLGVAELEGALFSAMFECFKAAQFLRVLSIHVLQIVE